MRNETKKHYMKRQLISSRSKKIACTVSAAALMLGVSSAATIGLHFMENYSCRNAAYSGYPVTLNAFGIPPSSWENLEEMENGYGGCPFTAPGYTLNEVIDTTTSTNFLNPLPNGSLNVTWFANSANFAPFYGNAGNPPSFTGGGPLRNPTIGAQQIYATFLRDGINFGPPGQADNPLKDYYYVDITGLKTLFTNTPIVVELIASSDSLHDLTNAFIIDEDNSITNSVTYPAIPTPGNAGGAPWLRGNGGGLSIASGVFSNVDHIHIMSNTPQHGTNGISGGYDNAGTISGWIMTDKPVVTMPPTSEPLVNLGDTIALSAYAIGVPPLSYQWQVNGQDIPGATATNYTVTNLTKATIGNYALVVTNLYGSTTSQVASVGAGHVVTEAPTASTNVVYDSNPDNAQHSGLNNGATWLASSTDSKSVTRTGVMSFGTFGATNAATNSIVVADNAAFDGAAGTVTFWMQSSGTDTNDEGTSGAAIICRPQGGSSGTEFVIYQQDAPATGLTGFSLNDGISLTGTKVVSDNNWHFVAMTYDTNGGAALFIDGVLDVTNNNGAFPVSLGPIDIGSGSDNFYRPYHGLLDDVRFYSTMLTPSEITTIQSSGAPADPADLQLEFEFAAPPGAGVNLSFPADPSAVLQTAPTITGPWAPAGATSPYTIIPAVGQQFFRYIYTHTNAPQTFITNPYLM
jgi:hypothetical protein